MKSTVLKILILLSVPIILILVYSVEAEFDCEHEYHPDFCDTIPPAHYIGIDTVLDSEQVFVFIDNLEIPQRALRDTIYYYTGFSLSYAEEFEQAHWVAYVHCRAKQARVASRTNTFLVDTSISTGSATHADYRGSGYDRGHLAPAGDMTWSATAMRESFYYSNMSPQLPQLNRGTWKTLEEKVRFWVSEFDTIYIVTGPVLLSGLPTIGKNNVAVPDYYYKVVLKYSSNYQDGIGFIMPNSIDIEKDIMLYAVSIDSVESCTGITFFPGLPESVQKKIKKNTCIAHWN